MDNIGRLRHAARLYLFGTILLINIMLVAFVVALYNYTELGIVPAACIGLAAAIIFALLAAQWLGGVLLQPVQALQQAILHLSPTEHGVAAPNIEGLRFGREIVANLTDQIYQLASVAGRASAAGKQQTAGSQDNFVAQNLPLPLLLLDANENIVFANQAAAKYLDMESATVTGKSIYDVVDMSFQSNDTFDNWLKTAKGSSATAVSSWDRVRLNSRDSRPVRLFDLAAYYNRDNPNGHDTMLVLFDHTKQYSQDDQAISFMAISVHELRTPLTLLRGYIEVFEDELGQQITDPQLQSFMLKMRAMAEQLTAYVNNILNVARIDDDQLELHLQSEDWGAILKKAVDIMSLRAKVRGITLNCRVAENLPTVGVDQLSIREVISNLIDNAIKYSGASTVIDIEAGLDQDGRVQTIVTDHGVGIPAAAIPNLFNKFYRDHHNRAQIGGTGLGLFLSKAIVDAHGGSLWVRSKEGEGSSFGFTLVPYSELADELKQNGNQEITRSAHGWIKNHSLYRR